MWVKVTIAPKNRPKLIAQEFQVLLFYLTEAVNFDRINSLKVKILYSLAKQFQLFSAINIQSCQLCWKSVISSLLTRKLYDVALLPPSGLNQCSMCRELLKQNEWIQKKCAGWSSFRVWNWAFLALRFFGIYSSHHHGSTAEEQHWLEVTPSRKSLLSSHTGCWNDGF